MCKSWLLKLLLPCVVFAAGCSSPYTPAPQILPAHVRKIYIRPFANTTNVYGLEQKLTLRLIDEFIRDGRLSLVNSESDADAIVTGEITRYILQPLTYDANMVTEQYKMWVIVNAHLIDRVNNVTLWTEPNLEGIQIYYDATKPGGKTEEEARDLVWDSLARSVVRRTIEGFGSVSGASDKKLP